MVEEEEIQLDRFGSPDVGGNIVQSGSSPRTVLNNVSARRASPGTRLVETPLYRRSKKTIQHNPNAVDPRHIPNTFNECDETDKQLIRMKDGGATWAACKKAYEESCGLKIGKSSVQNRYERLKQKHFNLPLEEKILMFKVKQQAEKDFEEAKWKIIADMMHSENGNVHDPRDLQRFYRKTMLGAGVHPPVGVRDPDFDSDNE